MKKRILILLIITILAFVSYTCIKVYAATVISSSTVSFDNSNGMTSENVKDAIDELYQKASTGSTSTVEFFIGMGTNNGGADGYRSAIRLDSEWVKQNLLELYIRDGNSAGASVGFYASSSGPYTSGKSTALGSVVTRSEYQRVDIPKDYDDITYPYLYIVSSTGSSYSISSTQLKMKFKNSGSIPSTIPIANVDRSTFIANSDGSSSANSTIKEINLGYKPTALFIWVPNPTGSSTLNSMTVYNAGNLYTANTNSKVTITDTGFTFRNSSWYNGNTVNYLAINGEQSSDVVNSVFLANNDGGSGSVNSTVQTINVGFRPSILLVFSFAPAGSTTVQSIHYYENGEMIDNNPSNSIVTITDNGFTYQHSSWYNKSAINYIAIK